MRRPLQKVHIIYDGKYYSFDAVIKIDHQHILEIAEEASDVEKKQHVNYAMLKPSTLTMEVMISDSVSAQNEPLTQGSGKRSNIAYRNLYNIQRSRKYLSIITEKHTFTKMLLETFSVSEDAETQNTMLATLVFKEMVVTSPAKKSGKPKSKAKPDPTQNDTPETGSILSQQFGDSGKRGLGKANTWLNNVVNKVKGVFKW